MTSSTLTRQLLSFKEREINVFAGDHAGRNLEASLKQARLLANLYRNVFYLNTVHNPWSLMATLRKVFGSDNAGSHWDRFEHLTWLDGRIATSFSSLKRSITDAKASILIINSWEFTSRNYRYRDELLYSLRQLALEYSLTIIVWTQRSGPTCDPGEWKYGLGKLGALAKHIMPVADILKPEDNIPPQEEASKNSEQLFVDYQIVDEDGEPVREETALEVTAEEASEEVAISPVGAIVRTADLDLMSLDLNRACANASIRDCKDLEGENWCPWEKMSPEDALAVMPYVNDPFSPHFAPYLWGSALVKLREDPKHCPPLPNGWEDIYEHSVWFRDLFRQAGFTSIKDIYKRDLESNYEEVDSRKSIVDS